MRTIRPSITFPILIFLVALILRLIPVLALREIGIGLDDMFQYDMLARSMAAGNSYRWYAADDLPLITSYIELDVDEENYDPRGVLTSFRPPLYPAFLALIYSIAGTGPDRFFIARLVQTLLSALLVPLTYALARRLFPDKKIIASLAAWIVALYPMFVIYPLSLATENLFFVLLLSSLLALVIASQEHEAPGGEDVARNRLIGFICRERWYLLAGILFGLTALTRSVSLALAGIAVLWVWFVLRARRQAMIVFIGVVALTLPWMVRNTLLHGQLTGIESALGYDLYVGYHPEGTGTFQYPQSLDLMTMVDDGLRDEIGRLKAWEFIRADPARFPYLLLRRAGYFFGLERRAMTYFYSNDFFGYLPRFLLIGLSIILCVPFVLVSLSSVLGTATISWRRGIGLLLLTITGYTLPHIFIIAEDRFHLSLVPFLAILAAAFWTNGVHSLGTRLQSRTGKAVLLFAGVIILFLVLNWGLELARDADKLALLFGPGGNKTYFPY